jgi:hypothetical protein
MSNFVTQPHLPSLYSYVAYMYIIPSPGLGERYRISLSEIVKAHSRSPSPPLACYPLKPLFMPVTKPPAVSWELQVPITACVAMSSLGLGSIERRLARSPPHTHSFSLFLHSIARPRVLRRSFGFIHPSKSFFEFPRRPFVFDSIPN